MLSRLVIAFLPKSKRLLISWLQSPSVVILEPKKIVCHCFHCFPIYLPWSDGTRCHDNSQPWCTPFLIWNQSIVPCPVLTVVSWPAVLKRQVQWSGIPISEEVSTVCCDPHSQRLGVVNKAEVDVFMELSCFFDDAMDVGNLISGSSVFYKLRLYIWNFSIQVLLKPSLKGFEQILLAWEVSTIVW